MKYALNIPSSLIISLDYELMWGMMDLPNAKQYGQSNVINVHKAICEMLKLFEKYQVKVTFATVGLLMCQDVEEVLLISPKLIPSYTKKWLNPYGTYLDFVKQAKSSLYFSPETVELLKDSKLIEIATHTFCHYYCWEEGQTIEEFEADIKTAVDVAARKKIEIKSIVFPRNNVNENYLSICHKYGITSYRGNALNFYGEKKSLLHFVFRRVCRLLDTYLPISNQCSYKYDDLNVVEGQSVNIPASRFFRPYSPQLQMLESVRIFRIKKEMEKAAKLGEMYHLWWHPHNFGANMEENLKNLENVLKHFSYCREKYGMQTYTMNELSEILIKKYGK